MTKNHSIERVLSAPSRPQWVATSNGRCTENAFETMTMLSLWPLACSFRYNLIRDSGGQQHTHQDALRNSRRSSSAAVGEENPTKNRHLVDGVRWSALLLLGPTPINGLLPKLLHMLEPLLEQRRCPLPCFCSPL